MARLYRSRIVLKLDPDAFPDLIVGATNIQDKMSQSASIFVAPTIPMPVLLQQIVDLSQAQQIAVTTRSPVTTAARAVKRDVLWSSLESDRAYVQLVCDGAPEHAIHYAELAGMHVAERPMRVKPVLAAALTATPGSVALDANASLLVAPGMGKARKRGYPWRYTIDGGKTFTAVDATPIARIVIPNLPLNTIVGFQVAAKDSVGVGDWSQMVSIFVHSP